MRTRNEAEFEDIYLELTDHLLLLTGPELRVVSQKARVHVSTLYRWLEGNTVSPRLNTLCRVARALGLEFQLVPAGKSPLVSKAVQKEYRAAA